jgi:hypothetical protein
VLERELTEGTRMRSIWFPLILLSGLPGWAAGQSGEWSARLAGNAFGLVTAQSTIRGADGLAGAGWLHALAARGGLKLEAMVSLEPLFEGKCGYPRILAGAPVCETDPFVDRSHAHPFIMKLGGAWEGPVGAARLGLAAGVAGDPALGPELYLHRPSAALDPIAPMLMHEINPAHAVHGLLTGALQARQLRLEASFFNGRGTDADPYDLDLAPLHSWSGRARLQLGAATSAELSHGDLEASSAHAAHGGANVRIRVDIASLETERTAAGFLIAATAAAARHKGEGDPTYAALLELQAQRGRHTAFARGEWAKRDEQESIHDLNTDAHFTVIHDFRVAELSGGYGLRLLEVAGLAFTGGTRASLSFIPAYLQPRYGHARATTITAFLNVRPAAVQHHHP